MKHPERKRPVFRRKPLQRDLFTGELVTSKIRKGMGDHIKLTHGADRQLTAIPGMAHFAGTGPARKYCQDCAHCQDLPVYRGGKYTSTTTAAPLRYETGACRKAADLYDGKVQKGGIGANAACMFFEEGPK